MENLKKEIEKYIPFNNQEKEDKKFMENTASVYCSYGYLLCNSGDGSPGR